MILVVATSDAKIIHFLKANDLLDTSISLMENILSNPTTYNYLQFLRDGIKKAEEASLRTNEIKTL